MAKGNDQLREMARRQLLEQERAERQPMSAEELAKYTREMRRLRCCFEGACARLDIKLDLRRNQHDEYTAADTIKFFDLWLSGHIQGVADHAVARGDIQL